MTKSGMPRQTFAPLLFQLLWMLGAQVPPPHFMGFGAVAFAFGVWFTFAWGTFMWLFIWSRNGGSMLASAVTAACAGVCFGLAMGLLYRYQRRKHRLPTWEALRDLHDPHDAATPALHR